MKTHFPFTQRKTIRGKTCWFYRVTWTDGDKRRDRYVRLPDNPDSPEFAQAYWSIRSGKTKINAKPPAHTWRALITAYKSSSRYRNLADRTKTTYSRVLDALIDKNADKDPTAVTRAEVRAIHDKYADTPRKADHYLQVMSILFNFGRLELDWPMQNPAEGIALFGSQREFEPWPEWLVKAWPKACAACNAPRALMAFHIGIATGQRPGDIVAMEWAHFDGEYVQVAQEKTGTRIEIYCPQSLRDYLASVPKQGKYLLAKNLTQHITYFALQAEIKRVRDHIGDRAKPYSMHGWRKLAAVQLAESGASDAEIQSVTGHKSLQMVQHYRKRATQKGMSKAAQQRREGSGTNKG